jgi:formylglycine-generating enzyme required for sulfatase activity
METSRPSRAVRIAVPLALIAAAAMTARAFDTSWIAPGQTLSADKLKTALDEVQARLAAIENRDCPPGYTVAAKPYISTNPDSVQCKNGSDVVVKVGRGPSAFWIDQYEATLWDTATGGGTQYGKADNDAHNAGFTRNAQWTKPMYALSVTGKTPSRYLTWFQANEACHLGGKVLAGRTEWLTAASGTIDPGANANAPACNTQSAGLRPTGMGAGACVSRWGAEDLIGNIWEWTDEWNGAPGTGSAFANDGATNWPSDYNADATWDLNTFVNRDEVGTQVAALPAAAVRGGAFSNGASAGVFAESLDFAPSYWSPNVGFRCAIR